MGTLTAVTRAKAWVRHAAAEVYARSWAFLEALRGKAAILTYHRVVSHKELSNQYVQPGMYVTHDSFEKQIGFLKEHFEILSFPSLLAMWDEQCWDPNRRYCVITFDDGWLDNYIYALPILKRYGVPATVFLPTGYVGTQEWFWPDAVAWIFRQCTTKEKRDKLARLVELENQSELLPQLHASVVGGHVEAVIECCKKLRPRQINRLLSRWTTGLGLEAPSGRQVINWEEAREMSSSGISFGSHSVSHSILTMLEAGQIAKEVIDSKATLERQGLKTVPVFCYPNGDWSMEVAEAVRTAGYKAAITTQFGYESPNSTNRFGLKRVNIHEHICHTEKLFAFHLAGYNNIRSR